jgi:type I restriction enzyme S subunit
LHPDYLAQCLISPAIKRALLNVAGSGATREAITKKQIQEFEIPLPPLDEQRRIAAILDQADALRRKRREALSKVSELPSHLFAHVCGDPASNPMGWPLSRLGDVCNSLSDGPHVSPEYVQSGIPFLSTRNIRPEGIVWEDLKFISKSDAENQWKKVKPTRGDVLYTKGGTTGIARAVDFDLDFAVWVHVAVLKVSKNKVEPVWVQEMLNSSYCYRQSQRLTKGIVNRDLGLRRMVDITFPLSPLALQHTFAARVAEIDKLKAQHRAHLAKLEALFASLQHRAFRGEL